jgi:drug/metabolite transporter (DMT)-like permease
MVGAGGGGGGGTIFQIALGFTLYGFFNLFLNYFNKWALSKGGFPDFEYPVFYSMWHMVASVLGSLVLMKIQNIDLPSVAQFMDYKWGLVALAMCSTVNICANNGSLVIIGLFVNQIIKATAPLPTMLMSCIAERKSYSWQVVTATLVLVAGAIMAVPRSDPTVTPLGIVLVFVATAASSIKPVFGAVLMAGGEKPKLKPAVLVFYDSFLSFFAMLLYWVCSPELGGSIAYMRAHTSVGLGIILAGSTAAFAYNMSVYYFTMVGSALMVIISSNLIKVCLITTSAIIDRVAAWDNWAGIIIFFLGVTAYSFFSYQAKAPKKEEPKPEGDVESTPAPTEKTPLAK